MSKVKAIEAESKGKDKSTELLNQKINVIAAGLPPSYGRNLQELPNQQNKKTIIEYISAMKTETNMSNGYRKENIDVLRRFSIFTQNKNFHDMTRDDILALLDNCRRDETTDPLHKWIGTYNQYRIYLLRFFKWLYSPNIEQDKRKTPSVLENIPRLRRREVSIYKPSDLWTQQDDLLFLKYCPSLRDKTYHAASRDLSCRPSEILG